jgi:hypothetical protein
MSDQRTPPDPVAGVNFSWAFPLPGRLDLGRSGFITFWASKWFAMIQSPGFPPLVRKKQQPSILGIFCWEMVEGKETEIL